MANEDLGPCKIKLMDKSGKIIEVEGSYGVTETGDPTIILPSDFPDDFEPVQVQVIPIVQNS